VGETLARIPGSGNSAQLSWTQLHHDHVTTTGWAHQVYVEGTLERVVQQVDETPVTGLRPNTPMRIDVLPLTLTEASLLSASTLFTVTAVGSRARLDWSAVPTVSDFAGTVILWDEGLGGDPTTHLATLNGPNRLAFVTAPLTDGTTYQFSLGFFDHVGNVSTTGAPTASVRIDRLPLALSAVTTGGFNAGVHAHSIRLSWTQPGGQHGDVAGVGICDNHVPGHGLLGAVNYGRAWRRAFVHSGTTTWESAPLFVEATAAASRWRFGLFAVDKYGNEGPPTEISVAVKVVGGALTLMQDPPEPVTDFDAVPVAAAKALLSWTHDEVDADDFRVYQDSVATYTVTTSGNSTHSFTTPALTDGQTYVFAVTARNAGGESAKSLEVSVVADSTAPGAGVTLTGTLVN
jgi:hypothetical protein